MSEQRWYFKRSVFVIALLCVGPLAMPLLWFNPNFSKAHKIWVSVAIIGVSIALAVMCEEALKSIINYYKLMV